jgi:HEAT repeat protein
MEERKMEDLMIGYVEGNLQGELKDHVEKTIAKNEDWKREHDRLSKIISLIDSSMEFTPDTSLRSNFNEMLNEEIRKADTSVIQMQPNLNWSFRIAAAVTLLLVGAGISYLITRNQQQQSDMLALKKEMTLTKQLVISSLQNQGSAISRLQGVNTSMVLMNSDDEIITALINTMNRDENTNVRLAALGALARFSDEQQVRDALLDALQTQDDPVVMINLINLMVKLKEEKAIAPLKEILEKDEILDAVKDEAHLGILKLS